MIFGIGCDIADIRRIRKIFARHPRRLPARILTAAERQEFAAGGFSPLYLAGRFAAKEALAKALRTGLRAPLTCRNVSVLADANGEGAPSFCFGESLQSFLQTKEIAKCHLSISHDGNYAAAFVVAEKAES